MTDKNIPTPDEVLAQLGSFDQYDRTHCKDEAPFLEFFSQPKSMTVFTRKKSKSAYGVNGRWIVKHWHYPSMPAPKSRYWEKEERALEWLDGLRAPHCFGYIIRVTDEGLDALLCREFIAGEALGKISEEDFQGIIDFFADIHSAGVTTEDPNAGNFMRTDEGISFIDYEWAKVHNSPWTLYLKIGKELAKMRLNFFPADIAAYRKFCAVYFSTTRPNIGARLLIAVGTEWWLLKRKLSSTS